MKKGNVNFLLRAHDENVNLMLPVVFPPQPHGARRAEASFSGFCDMDFCDLRSYPFGWVHPWGWGRREDRKGKDEKEKRKAEEGTQKEEKGPVDRHGKMLPDSQGPQMAQTSWLLICLSRPICDQKNIGSATTSFRDLEQAF